MDDVLRRLYDLILSRKENAAEGSYTGYLFEQGLDKILKKVGEECAETIIAAKNTNANNGNNDELVLEICDLAYHLMVLMVQSGVGFDAVAVELEARAKKQGNLKTMKQTDKNT